MLSSRSRGGTLTPEELAAAAGADPDHPLIAGHAPAVRLRTDGEGVRGGSRIGGHPDLPDEVAWPTWDAGPYFLREAELVRERLGRVTDEGARAELLDEIRSFEAAAAAGPRPLSFVAQLRCADLRECGLPLPADGLLSFFYDLGEQPWGYDPLHRGAWRLLHLPEGRWAERPAPGGDGPLLRRGLRAEAVITFPRWVERDDEVLDWLDDEDLEAAWDLLQESDPAPRHQVGGHADPVQGDLGRSCALVTNGIYVGESPRLPAEDLAELTRDAPRWKLVLQLDSDDELEMGWGDEGRIYVMMRDDDLERGAWDRAWLRLQCG
ncbi:MAG: DUF1963 domain-containing protein [Alphaproteobacteria bacterium]|nr:DUF1963 domain-containing protein [Alphaproteobacteria bacterium]MCB9697684.1 DUF1963 domain-containing protein [Alphaproteobacteria bacterium]